MFFSIPLSHVVMIEILFNYLATANISNKCLHCYKISWPMTHFFVTVDGWRKKHKLSYLGVPKLLGCGVHQKGNVKYRFLVMPRFGDDIWKKYLACNKKFPATTTFALALQIVSVVYISVWVAHATEWKSWTAVTLFSDPMYSICLFELYIF